MATALHFNFDKKCCLDAACADEKSMQPALEYIYFKDGYAYATNAHIYVRANLRAIANLLTETIEELNGHCIHKGYFSVLKKYDQFKVVGDQIITYMATKGGNLVEGKHIPLGDKNISEDVQRRVTDLFSNLYYRSEGNDKAEYFGFDFAEMEKAYKAIGYRGKFAMTFIGGKALLSHESIYTADPYFDIHAILAPCVLQSALMDYITKRI